jgi:hypothetical protein
MAIRPMDVEAGTPVVIHNGRHEVFKPGTTGEITRSGAYRDERTTLDPRLPARLMAQVRVTSGAYAGRTFSIALSQLEIR